MKWMAEKEATAENRRFSKMNENEKRMRLQEVKSLVEELKIE
jgi:hypothetical protein